MKTQARIFAIISRLRQRRPAATSCSALSSLRPCRLPAVGFPTRDTPEMSGSLLLASGNSAGMRAITCIIQPCGSRKEQTPGCVRRPSGFGRCAVRHIPHASTISVAPQHGNSRHPIRALWFRSSAQATLGNSRFGAAGRERRNNFLRSPYCARATKPIPARCKAEPMGA
jgi:hypothetical protein